MNPAAEPGSVLAAMQRMVRSGAGKTMPQILKSWRYTSSGEEWASELTPESLRTLVRLGAVPPGAPSQQAAAAVEWLRTASRISGEAPGVLARFLGAFASGEYGVAAQGRCGEVPECERCELAPHCAHALAPRGDAATPGALPAGVERDVCGELLASPVPPHQQVSPAEALALLLAGGNPGPEILRRAQAAVRSGPGLRGLLQPLVAHSAAEAALSASERAHLLALRALLAHWTAEPVERGRPFTCGQDFFDAYHLRLRDLKQEVFIVVQLDQKNHLIGDDQVSLGTLSETLVHPREVFANALARRAAAVALIHNHPSGDPTPSSADCDVTRRLNTVAKVIGIRLLDHIVIGDGRFTSFVETGIMP